MTTLEAMTTIRRSPDAISRLMAGEALIVNLNLGQYYGLDPVGTRVWELIAETTTFAGILRAMLDEFDVDEERLEADLRRLFQELSEKQLVQLGDAPSP